jgi:hypothetical protein
MRSNGIPNVDAGPESPKKAQWLADDLEDLNSEETVIAHTDGSVLAVMHR